MSDTKCPICGMDSEYHGATCTAGGSFAAPAGSASLRDQIMLDESSDAVDQLNRLDYYAGDLRKQQIIANAILKAWNRIQAIVPNAKVSSGAKNP